MIKLFAIHRHCSARDVVLAVAVFSICLTFSTSPAFAYLDSNTGSLILQIGLGIVAGGIVTGYLYRREIADRFRRMLGRK